VSTMSKQSKEKIQRYMPELALNSEIMKVMAGFQTNEEYYVPCCLLMPWTEGEMVLAVFLMTFC
jgi:hypothetical protein